MRWHESHSEKPLEKRINSKKQKEDKSMSIIRLGSPAIPVKITEYGTCLAKLEHLWQAARRYSKRNGYRVVETYGVMGVAPF